MTNVPKSLTIGNILTELRSYFALEMRRSSRWRLAVTMVLLWMAFAAYRAYFWDNISEHGAQVSLNSLADVLLACTCGLLIYTLQIRKTARKFFLPATLLLLVAFSFGLYWAHSGIYTAFGLLTADFRGLFDAICFQLLDSFAVIVCGSLAIVIQQQHFDRQQIVRAMEVMELENQRVELKYLTSQMDPHFVFNGLNMIYHQVPEESKTARESLLQFSGILRYHLNYAAGDKVSLREEKEYLHSYIQFQKKRCQDFMEIEEDLYIEDTDNGIEPLLLLPLVENAVKFCDGSSNEKGKLKVHLRHKNRQLSFHVQNSYLPERAMRREGHGIGLENLKRRLDIIYSGKHKLEIISQPEQQLFTCNLTIWS